MKRVNTVAGATGNNQLKDEIMKLFEDITCPSKKDNRGEAEYRKLHDLLSSKMIAYIAILKEEPTEGYNLLLKANKNCWKAESLTVNRDIMATWLSFKPEVIQLLVSNTIRVLVKETVMHEQALFAAGAMIAKAINKHFKSVHLIVLKRRVELGTIEFLAAMQLLEIARLLGFYKIKQRAAKEVQGRYTHSYDVCHFKFEVSENLQKYLTKYISPEASTSPLEPRLRFSGSFNKYNDTQPSTVYKAITKLQAVEFEPNRRLIKQMRMLVNKSLQNTDYMEQFNDLLETVSSYHFKVAMGPDNGRFYLNGWLLPAQGGARNWLSEFKEKQILNEVGNKYLQLKLASYEDKDFNKMLLKDKIEYASYLDAETKAKEGKPVGNFLGLDGRLFGPLTHALLLRDKTQYHYCTAEDGREYMAKTLGLTKYLIKGGMSPYVYGAGKNTTIAGIVEFNEKLPQPLDIDAIVHTTDFWEKWETEFQKYFPATYKLREFVRGYVKNVKDLGHRVDYTTWGGFNATITPLQTIMTHHNTVMGKRTYTREDVVANEFGSKLVAAIGHELDSSILLKLLLVADYEIKPVHDEYCVHLNDGEKLERDHLKICKDLYREGPAHLQQLLDQMFSTWVERCGSINIRSLITGTLAEEDIVSNIN